MTKVKFDFGFLKFLGQMFFSENFEFFGNFIKQMICINLLTQLIKFTVSYRLSLIIGSYRGKILV